MSARTWVYVIASMDGEYVEAVKIGCARDPKWRLKMLQIGSVAQLQLIDAFLCERSEEKRLHRLLAPYRLHGEWFRGAREVCERIAAEMAPHMHYSSLFCAGER